jgi:hypothetical protein
MATTGATSGEVATNRSGVGRAVRRVATETKQAFWSWRCVPGAAERRGPRAATSRARAHPAPTVRPWPCFGSTIGWFDSTSCFGRRRSSSSRRLSRPLRP